MESWFALAITPMLTYLWKAFLVSNLQGKKPLNHACDLISEEWEDCGLSDSYLRMR